MFFGIINMSLCNFTLKILVKLRKLLSKTEITLESIIYFDHGRSYLNIKLGIEHFLSSDKTLFNVS